MAQRQTRNVSLPPAQDAFVEALVRSGRYRTASEVVREGIRRLETEEHERLLETWLRSGLDEDEKAVLPPGALQRLRARVAELIGPALRDAEAAPRDAEEERVHDGPEFFEALRESLRDPER